MLICSDRVSRPNTPLPEQSPTLKTIDFSRSVLTFRHDSTKRPSRTASHKPRFSLNNARIAIECRCRVTHLPTGETQSFVLGASCKTERIGVERDIWTEPNGDFAPIFSDDRFLLLKTFARAGIEVDLFSPDGEVRKQPDRQTGTIADFFDNVRIDLVEREGTELSTPEQIVQATLSNRILVARTEIAAQDYSAQIDHPVKTMNANERDMIYQTDTGPLLLPDLSGDPETMIERLELAFAAFNCPEWTEFVVRVPTPVRGDVSVYHYSHPVRFDATNRIIDMS